MPRMTCQGNAYDLRRAVRCEEFTGSSELIVDASNHRLINAFILKSPLNVPFRFETIRHSNDAGFRAANGQFV